MYLFSKLCSRLLFVESSYIRSLFGLIFCLFFDDTCLMSPVRIHACLLAQRISSLFFCLFSFLCTSLSCLLPLAVLTLFQRFSLSYLFLLPFLSCSFSSYLSFSSLLYLFLTLPLFLTVSSTTSITLVSDLEFQPKQFVCFV